MKYTFTPNTKVLPNGSVLKQIRRISDGSYGGYIESEENLSQEGPSWVSENAQVSGQAMVSENAQVFGNAWVYGNAQVSGQAMVSENAQVFGNAWVYGNAQVSENVQVSGNDQVSGDAWVPPTIQVYENPWWTSSYLYKNAQVSANAQTIAMPVFGPPTLFSHRINCQLMRVTARTLSSKPRFLSDGRTAYYLSGGVHLASEEVLKLYETKKRKAFDKEKTPATTDKHIGIELEFLSTLDESDIRQAFIDANLQDVVSYHEDSSVSGDDSDCSGDCHSDCDEECSSNCHGCSGTQKGHEICVLTKQSTFRSTIRRVCKVLKSLDAEINTTCGMHVHIDMRTREVETAYMNLVNSLPVLTSIVPKSRLSNHYCKRNETANLSTQKSIGQRYYMVNVESLSRHSTLEVRLHSGTTNPIKIINWVTLLLRIVNGKAIETSVTSIAALRQHVRLSRRLALYMQSRRKEFDKTYAIEESDAGEHSETLHLAA